jgi:hypothetical protein
MIGPYGSYTGNPASRVCFWVSVFWAGAVLLWPSIAAALYCAARRNFPLAPAGAAAALLACIPLAAFAAAACSLFWPVHAAGMRPQEWYAQTVLLALPGSALAVWLEWDRTVGLLRASPAGFSRPPALLAQGMETAPLPDHLLDLIICLQMEDHHVRYYTARGSQLYFAAMRDVVTQLGAERGLQVHRSWWVARSAVRATSGDTRALSLVLSNGLQVPVSRSRVAAVRAAGWLDGLTAPTQ